MFRFFFFFSIICILYFGYIQTLLYFLFFILLLIKNNLQINNDLLILNKHINESIYLLNLIDWFNLFLKTITVLVNNKIIMFNLLSLTIFSFQFFVFYIYYKSESAADLAGRISSYSS